MQDRDIYNDVLDGTKHSISCYTNAIVETSNQQLRSTWQTLRSEAEQAQYQIYQMAEQKGYYKAAPQASNQDLQTIKSSLTSALSSSNSSSGSSSNIYSGSTSGNTSPQSGMSMPGVASSVNPEMTSSSATQFSNSVSNSNKTSSKQSKNKR